jgi:excisionase family DNA binding protein
MLSAMKNTHDSPINVNVYPKPLLTVKEFWQATGKCVGINRLRQWADDGTLRCVHVGRKRLIPRSEVERLGEIDLGGPTK